MEANLPVGVLFDGSFDGFLTIIFDRYYQNLRPVSIDLQEACQQALGVEYLYVNADPEKALKVEGALFKKLTPTSLNNVYNSFMADTDFKYFPLYNYVIMAFKFGREIDRYQTDDNVSRVLELSRNVTVEAHHLMGFTRFSETSSGVFYAAISPKHDVINLLAGHFSSRFSTHPWIVHDKKRNKAAVYDGKDCVIVQTPMDVHIEYSCDEKQYRDRWIVFFKSIAIKERENPDLQRSNLPLRFRPYITEFNELF